MEVAVNGPDGATHLVLCTGIANLSACSHEIFTFCVGPRLSRRQFVGAIASGALATIQVHGTVLTKAKQETALEARLVSIAAMYEEESEHVKISAEVTSSTEILEVAISYHVNILAELSGF